MRNTKFKQAFHFPETPTGPKAPIYKAYEAEHDPRKSKDYFHHLHPLPHQRGDYQEAMPLPRHSMPTAVSGDQWDEHLCLIFIGVTENVFF